MKKIFKLIIPGLMLSLASCFHSPDSNIIVEWMPVNNTDSTYIQTFTLSGDLRDLSGLAFCQVLTDPMYPLDQTDTIKELLPGYYLISSPKFQSASGNDTISFSISTTGTFRQRSFGPDGVHLVKSDGTPIPVEIVIGDILKDSSHYSVSSDNRMPLAETIYDFNKSLLLSAIPDIYEFIPKAKSVVKSGSKSEIDLDEIEFEDFIGEHPEEYIISISGGKINVKAPVKMWKALKLRLNHYLGTGSKTLPDAVISDYPDFPYRGLHIDVARNWIPVNEIKIILDQMAIYGLNKLHFHLVDDEGWRLDIPSLPELTEVGSKRGFSTTGYSDFLPQRYGGDPLYIPGAVNERLFISREEYIDLLRHADTLGIEIIPEIETPGHARASIMAMKERARHTGDDSWLLTRPDDKSVYETAQGYHDAVMDPSLDGPYKLLSTVFDEIISMHKEAGVPLPAIHIGGDEVPHGSWSGNEHIRKIMQENNFTTEEEVHAWFMRKVADIYSDKGLKLMAWEEVAKGHGEVYDNVIQPITYGVNLWTFTGNKDVIRQISQSGYPLIISNVDRYYLDMAYSGHPCEKGLSWGGFVDEFKAFEGHPIDMCPFLEANILGVQGEVWSETVRSVKDVERLLFPKLLGLSERAWNNDSTYSRQEFNSLICREMPKWENSNIEYHLRQPGILIKTGKAYFNSPYNIGEIRYTFDSSEPSFQAPVAKDGEGVDIPEKTTQIRAAIFLNGKKSCTTLKEL